MKTIKDEFDSYLAMCHGNSLTSKEHEMFESAFMAGAAVVLTGCSDAFDKLSEAICAMTDDDSVKAMAEEIAEYGKKRTKPDPNRN